jgi:hypothetical protein
LEAQQTSLEGDIPPGLWRLTNLATIKLYNTKLSGTIGTEVGRMTVLKFFVVNNSELSGTIPTGESFLRNCFCVEHAK